jgi:hypothetical protein
MANNHTRCRKCGATVRAMGAHYVGHHPLTDEVRQEIADYARSHRRNLRLPMLCQRFARGHDAIRAILIEIGVRLPGMKRAPFEHLAPITLAEWEKRKLRQVVAVAPVAPPASPSPAEPTTAEAFVEAFMERMLGLERQVISLQQEVATLQGDLSAAEELLEVQRSPTAGNWQNKLAQVAATLGMPNKRDSQ